MMQSQGLGALMPQAAQQMAPQQADPQRLAAATNLVSSDAERQILDPRTLALIKYKDAIQAMQAADQMMAAAQPAPMPPTVAERTKLAAEQGIAGLASKLGAGIQQQGNNMQAQQMQQAMSGGLPQLPAPNMAGMAEGGIVGESARDIGTLARSVVDASALPFAAYEAAGQYGPNLSEIASAVAAGYRGEEAPEVPGMFDRRAEGQAPTDASTAVQTPTATQGQAVGTPRVQPAQQGFTPAPESMSGGMREPTPVERLRAAAAENTAQQGGKDAVDALLEEEQQPRAGESAADRDARRRMLIAGLRGFGAQGLGGFAAGTAEEELRQEQEVIADQERQRRAAMEDRELSLKDREVTLMDEIRRQQLDADIRQRAEQALLRLEALGSAEQQFVQEQIGERTANIDQLIQNMNLSLISGNVRGRDADALRNQILALQEQKANIIEEALINLQQPDRSAAIRAAEEAAYGSGGRGFNPEDFTVRQTSSQ
jgi:hypothetical protein